VGDKDKVVKSDVEEFMRNLGIKLSSSQRQRRAHRFLLRDKPDSTPIVKVEEGDDMRHKEGNEW